MAKGLNSMRRTLILLLGAGLCAAANACADREREAPGSAASRPAPADRGFDPWAQAARYRINYEADLTRLASPHTRLRVWIPLPADGDGQRVEWLDVQCQAETRQMRDALGNRMVYLDLTPAEPPPALRVRVRALVVRDPYRGAPAPAVAPAVQRALRANRKIPLSGPIRERAERVCRGLPDDGAKIRALYDHVLATMRYDKRGTGWGRGDALWACRAGYGNCTDFHSLLIALARSQGIAARFCMGFALPADRRVGRVGGYHCWAELYDRQRQRWIPVDASEASKRGRPDDYFGLLPADRILFTVGRDLRLEPPQDGEALNYFIDPYAELDGQPAGPVPWSLRFERLEP